MSEPTEVFIAEVKVAVPAGIGVEAGMVVLAERPPPYRLLRIIVGQAEARAIQSAWTRAAPARPSTWDLLVSSVNLLGGRIQRAVITGVEQQRHYFAVMDLERDGQVWSVACRPSDAIAVALRSEGTNIYAAPEVLDAAGVLADGSRPAPPA
ncbi:MAG TPA: bifunctional nuclease family protein [Acidimicrobiales bacterium]|nr:bifunctional nuclease family protein [Acidimicrobiales bacterium]